VKGVFLSAYLEAAGWPWYDSHGNLNLGSNFSKEWNKMPLLEHQDQHQLSQRQQICDACDVFNKCRVGSADNMFISGMMFLYFEVRHNTK
jgi:hypothetical protein